MASKESIFNLALGALMLSRHIADATTDRSNEASVLNTHYDTALKLTLGDLNLDSMSEVVVLSLVQELVDDGPYEVWRYAYAYPSNCARLRGLYSGQKVDSRYSEIQKRLGRYDGQKVIFSNEAQARAQVIFTNIDPDEFSSEVELAIAYRLAFLSAPLITGKGAAKLREDIRVLYAVAKAEAQGQDQQESGNIRDDEMDSNFVLARLS